MKTLSFNQMQQVKGGSMMACAATMGLVTTIWGAAAGLVNPLAGAIVSFGFGLFSSWVCGHVNAAKSDSVPTTVSLDGPVGSTFF
ncbi:MAG: hypothetical protein LBC98_03130 [Prevotellaceae bacterium]|jgi:hypothetical protein|nr:hypothetical protein [Prevotellaceae bacterium]